ncbi:adenine deaminase [Pedobacter sp. UYP30]|uniref:adenine deaminase n=1 Tax=Pedobacter sp. UYP30 TaxID=1756400 RepID=UPI003393BD7F
MNNFKIEGNFVDILGRKIFYAALTIADGKVAAINKIAEQKTDAPFIIPGFIDSHVHIESSMLIPTEFAKLAVVHGTVATVSDPHEIANVCGVAGVDFMIADGNKTPFKFYFGAPSCVPATAFETAGAEITSVEIEELLARPEIVYLTEMMNFPGVLNDDREVLKKIAIAKKLGKPIDGHAPGLRGEALQKYIDAGISTDHECFTEAEALEKLKRGMHILIREGSAAKNFEALIGLIDSWPEKIMFCSDDKHPDSLVLGHINLLCKRAVAKGADVFNVLRAACLNPILHYDLKVGKLEVGNPADFTLVKNLTDFEVMKTFLDGKLVAENGKAVGFEKATSPTEPINNFSCEEKQLKDFKYPFSGEETIAVIEALDEQLITNRLNLVPKIFDDEIISDIENDVLKMVVINRYFDAPTATAFVKNFGLKTGALASSVAHDSHNTIAVGVDDESICRAVNLIIKHKGGICAINGTDEEVLPLPVAGLMSNSDGYEVARAYTSIDLMAKSMGSKLFAPFMTLSFMALLVIPSLKLSDKGLFDGDKFEFVGQL